MRKQKEYLQETKRYKETILLRECENDYIHVETSLEQLADTFVEIAENNKVDAEKARKYFLDNVDFSFYKGSDQDKRIIDRLYKNKFDKLIELLKGGNFLGMVIPKNKKCSVLINLETLNKVLPKIKKKNVLEVKDYQKQNVEQRIASFRKSLQSVTEHELFHVFQHMVDSNRFKKADHGISLQNRLILAFTLAMPLISSIPSMKEYAAPATAVSGLILLGFTVRLGKDKAKIESDAYEFQGKALSMNFKSPYSLLHEKG